MAIFLWPKLSQLPVLTAADRSRVHEDARAQISPKADDAEAGPWGDLSGEEPRATRRTPNALEWEDEKEKEDSAMENERHSRVVEGRRIVFVTSQAPPLCVKHSRYCSSSERNFSWANRREETNRSEYRYTYGTGLIFLPELPCPRTLEMP